jgi:AraC-like DNA-binding protein
MLTSKTYIIKGMVCDRCISSIKSLLTGYSVDIIELELGKMVLKFNPKEFNEHHLASALHSLGFSIGNDKATRVADQVKEQIAAYFQNFDPTQPKERFSKVLSEHLFMSYDTISSIFSTTQQMTIENYIIFYRIDWVKKMLGETHYTLTEIAFRTGFSSVHHLSRQFKDVVGVSPSEYKVGIIHKNDVMNPGLNVIAPNG